MPSNYTISKELKRVADYLVICDEEPGNFPDAAWMMQNWAGRLDEAIESCGRVVLEETNEYGAEVVDAVVEIVEGKQVSALAERAGVPLTVLKLTEIKGIGAKMARGLFRDLDVVDLDGLRAVIEDGRIGMVKGFGPKTIDKITAYLNS